MLVTEVELERMTTPTRRSRSDPVPTVWLKVKVLLVEEFEALDALSNAGGLPWAPTSSGVAKAPNAEVRRAAHRTIRAGAAGMRAWSVRGLLGISIRDLRVSVYRHSVYRKSHRKGEVDK